jgi:hypothetical protein
MVEDVQRLLVLFEDELKVIVVRSIADSDHQQIRRPTPEQADCDSVALACGEFRPPSLVCRIEHREIPSLVRSRDDSIKKIA